MVTENLSTNTYEFLISEKQSWDKGPFQLGRLGGNIASAGYGWVVVVPFDLGVFLIFIFDIFWDLWYPNTRLRR